MARQHKVSISHAHPCSSFYSQDLSHKAACGRAPVWNSASKSSKWDFFDFFSTWLSSVFSQSQSIDDIDRASLMWISKGFDGKEPGSARITLSCVPELLAHTRAALSVPVCTLISALHRTSLCAHPAF